MNANVTARARCVFPVCGVRLSAKRVCGRREGSLRWCLPVWCGVQNAACRYSKGQAPACCFLLHAPGAPALSSQPGARRPAQQGWAQRAGGESSGGRRLPPVSRARLLHSKDFVAVHSQAPPTVLVLTSPLASISLSLSPSVLTPCKAFCGGGRCASPREMGRSLNGVAVAHRVPPHAAHTLNCLVVAIAPPPRC